MDVLPHSRKPARPRALRAYLFRALLAVSLIPVLMLSLLAARRTYRIRQGALENLLTARAGSMERRIDDYLDTYSRAIRALAGMVPGAQRADPRAWAAAVHHFHETYAGFLTMLVSDRQGRVLLASSGGVVRTELPGATDVSDREYFRRGIADTAVFVSGAFRGRGLGTDPLVAISRSYAGASGAPGGIVEGSLDLQKLLQFAADSFNRNTAILILDGRDCVTFSSPALPFSLLQDLKDSPFAQAQSGAVFRYRGPDREYVVAGSGTRSPYGWKVFVFDPASNFRTTVREWLRNLLLVLLAGPAMCLLVAVAVARGVTLPLEQLAARVRRLMEVVTTREEDIGRPPKLNAGAPAEVASLQYGIEFMAWQLRASYARLNLLNDDLERRVGQRMLDLDRKNLQLQAAVQQKTEAETELTLFKRAVLSASEGITIADAQQPGQPLVYVNPAFETLTGYPAAEALGRNCRFLQGVATDPTAVAELRLAIAEQRSCMVELLNYRKDGTSFWNRLSITPIQAADGRVTHFVGVQVDITHHKEIDRLKSELVSTVSHELRTPLTSLHGFAELILNRQLSPERTRQFVGIIHRESRRLTDLINDFLDLQRIEAGRQEFRIEPCAIEDLLREASQLLAADGCEHPLSLRLDDPLPLVSADRQRVRQVLDNLLSNARKFSPAGSEIEIVAAREGEEVVVSVRDRGIGIPAEALPKLFTRFFRVDNTETRRIGGTGLGLELARKLMESQSGRIWVTSEFGAGSTFFISLKVACSAYDCLNQRNTVASPAR